MHSGIIGDPGNRDPIENYHPGIRDLLMRAYASGGPTQPKDYAFPRKWQSGEWRSFQKSWFDEFEPVNDAFEKGNKKSNVMS
jgi:hypothetical protein